MEEGASANLNLLLLFMGVHVLGREGDYECVSVSSFPPLGRPPSVCVCSFVLVLRAFSLVWFLYVCVRVFLIV